MKISILALLLFLGLTSAVFSEDNRSGNCLEQLKKEANTGSKISILKKDQQTVSGYLNSVSSDSITVASKSSYHFGMQQTTVNFNEIDLIKVKGKKSRYKTYTAIELTLVGTLTGGAIGYVIDKNYVSNNGGEVKKLIVIGSGVAGGLIANLGYRLITSIFKKDLIISCGE